MGFLEKALNAAHKGIKKNSEAMKKRVEKGRAKRAARDAKIQKLKAERAAKPVIKPFIPKSQQPATSAKPVAVTPK